MKISGAEILMECLLEQDVDAVFGYPGGTILNVYDALVSKRVYKDSLSFEEADRIITEGMGKHFDPQLQECYNRARPRLEDFYRHENQTEEEKARAAAIEKSEAEMAEERERMEEHSHTHPEKKS